MCVSGGGHGGPPIGYFEYYTASIEDKSLSIDAQTKLYTISMLY